MSEIKAEMITVEGLIEIPKEKVLEVFCEQKKLKPFIKKIEKEVAATEFDLSTKKGRDEIASRAYKVSKIKGALIKVADAALVDAKKLIKDAGEGKKYLTASLDTLRDTTRKPLNDWEKEEAAKEEQRLNAIKERIDGIKAIAFIQSETSNEELSSLIEAADAIDCSEGFDEFAQEALQAKSEVKEFLTKTLNDKIQKQLAEQQQIELDAKQALLDEKEKSMQLKAKAQERLNNLMMIPTGFFGKTSFEINVKINKLENYEILEAEFGELFEAANNAKAQVIQQLNAMATQQAIVEANTPVVEQEQPTIEQPVVTGVDIGKGDETVTAVIKQPFKTTTRIEISPLDRDLNFWASEYGIDSVALSTLKQVLKKHVK